MHDPPSVPGETPVGPAGSSGRALAQRALALEALRSSFMKRLPRALLVSSLLVEAAMLRPGMRGERYGLRDPRRPPSRARPPARAATPPRRPRARRPPRRAPTPPLRSTSARTRTATASSRFDDPTDDDGEDAWDAKHGAVFLANIDDDEQTCPTQRRATSSSRSATTRPTRSSTARTTPRISRA